MKIMARCAAAVLVQFLAFVGSAIYAAPAEISPAFRMVRLPLRMTDVPPRANADAEAKILVGGYLPSTCYQKVETKVESPDPHTHFVRALAQKLIDRRCTQVIEDFEEQVSLGRLDAGEHTLIVEAAHGEVLIRRFTVLR